jgi:hypothetical protein
MSDNALGLRHSMLLALQLARNNRSLFIDAMDDPMRRRIAFDVVERNCRERFAEGEDGVRLYLQLLGYVQSAKVDKAVEEFERRFERLSRCSTKNSYTGPSGCEARRQNRLRSKLLKHSRGMRPRLPVP